MKKIDVELAIAVVLMILATYAFEANAFTFEDYLTEVKTKNSSIVSSEKTIKGSSLRGNEHHLYWAPTFFFNGNYSDDERQTTAPAFQGTETIRKTYQAGLSQQFRSGTKASFSYNLAQTTINGANPALLPVSNFYDVSPQVELTQSLWKNWWGGESRASEEIIKSGAEASNLVEKFRYKQLVMNAEMNYWRLAFAQKAVSVQKESLERAQKLKDWAHNRQNSGLADESDYLQANSAFTARELEYQTSLIEEKSASRTFNTLRESEDEKVVETLSPPEDKDLLELKIPERSGNREDLEAAAAQTRIAKANSQLGEERNKPTLELYGSYSLNGRAANNSSATDTAWTTDHPYSIVGVRFSTPINLGNLNHNREGYAQEKIAADYSLKRKSYEVEREWKDLVNKFHDYQDRLKLSQKMENSQKEKLMREKARLGRGRSTTFQILQFEQDYANAQLLKLRYESELINTYSQLKLFSGVNHE